MQDDNLTWIMKEDSADIQIPQKQRLRFGDPILIQRLQSKREDCDCRRDERLTLKGRLKIHLFKLIKVTF